MRSANAPKPVEIGAGAAPPWPPREKTDSRLVADWDWTRTAVRRNARVTAAPTLVASRLALKQFDGMACGSHLPFDHSGRSLRFTIIFAAVERSVSGTLLAVLKILKSRGVSLASCRIVMSRGVFELKIRFRVIV